MSAAPGCHCPKITVSSFLKHPCCNNRFIRQHQARLASTQCGSPRLSNSKFATGTPFHSTPSNGHRCSAFFKFGKSNEYKGVLHSATPARPELHLLTGHININSHSVLFPSCASKLVQLYILKHSVNLQVTEKVVVRAEKAIQQRMWSITSITAASWLSEAPTTQWRTCLKVNQ